MKNIKKPIKTQRDIYDYYWDLSQFMGQFELDADFDKFDEIETIKEYNFSSAEDFQFYIKVKSQAEELINMKPFPYNAIQDSANRNLARNAKNEEEKIKMVKDWLIKVLDLLEKRVTGKL
jgi:hypothetical protein